MGRGWGRRGASVSDHVGDGTWTITFIRTRRGWGMGLIPAGYSAWLLYLTGTDQNILIP